MSGNISNFVRRNDEPQSGRGSKLASLARRKELGNQAKINKSSRQGMSIQQAPVSTQPKQFSAIPPVLHRHYQSIPQKHDQQMKAENQESHFMDSELESDFEETIIVGKDPRENENLYHDDHDDQEVDFDNNEQVYADREYIDQRYEKQSYLSNVSSSHQVGNGYSSREVDPHAIINNLTNNMTDWNEIPVHRQTVPASYGVSSNAMSYSGRFDRVPDNLKSGPYDYRACMEETVELRADRTPHRQFQDNQLRKQHSSRRLAVDLDLEQSQDIPVEARSDDDIPESFPSNGHHHRNDASAVPEDSHHNEPPSSNSAGNLEESRNSSPDQITPHSNNKNLSSTESLGERPRLKRTAVELDYDEDTLRKLKYSELKDQVFEDNPNATSSLITESLSPFDVVVEDRLKHFYKENPDRQSQFFEQMHIEDWEQAGDWFLKRFGDIMDQLRTARRERRGISKKFEEELADREYDVQERIQGINQRFAKMKEGGQGVLQVRLDRSF